MQRLEIDSVSFEGHCRVVARRLDVMNRGRTEIEDRMKENNPLSVSG
jgi:hypothetical protein